MSAEGIYRKIDGDYNLAAELGSNILPIQDIYLECDTTLVACNIQLPAISGLLGFFNNKIFINDNAGNAGTNNITVTRAGSDLINAATTCVINSDGQSGKLEIVGTTDWFWAGSAGVQATDTDWIDLAGFGFYDGTLAKPQYRVMGKQLVFRNGIVVPLDNGGVVYPYGSAAAPLGSTYVDKTVVVPFTGAGGVTINASGGLIWNNGNPVITNAAHRPDQAYTSGYVMGFRRVVSSSPGTDQLFYSGIFRLIIGADGVLQISTLFNDEEGIGGQLVGNSIMRYVTSQAIAGQFTLDYRDINAGAATLLGITPSGAFTPSVAPQAIAHAVTLDAADPNTLGGWVFLSTDLRGYLAL